MRAIKPGEKKIPRAEYRETFEHAGVGIAHVSTSGHFLDVNARFCEMVGLPRETLEKMRFQDITYPTDLDSNVALLDDVIEGKISGYRIEKRYIRSNGELFWADLTASVIRDEIGAPVKIISVINDITRQKADEERQRFLLAELSHRTKNLVAVMQAIVSQAFVRSASREEMRDTIFDRLAGIAASQDALVAQEDRAAPIRELVALQLAVFLPRNDPRIEVDGHDIALGAGAARAIGMALHELGTNACKYGALSTTAGRVMIGWSVGSGIFRMSWQERGGPKVRPPTRRGFGRLVVEQMVATSTGGDVRLAFDPDGIVWSLEAPAGAVCASVAEPTGLTSFR